MLKKISNIVFYAVAIFLFLFVFFELFMPSKTIDYLGIKTYVVLTPSMEPDINVNDMIVVKKVKQENIDVGDAISFEVYVRDLDQRIIVTHYVGAIETNSEEAIYKTMGAGAEEGDYDIWRDKNHNVVDVTYDDIVGEVMFRIPYLGHVVKVVQSPVMVGLLAFNMMIIYALVRVIKHKPKIEE